MPAFNPEVAVRTYWKVKERLESEKGVARKTLQADVKRKHLAWKKWQGGDFLHEMAYVEPIE